MITGSNNIIAIIIDDIFACFPYRMNSWFDWHSRVSTALKMFFKLLYILVEPLILLITGRTRLDRKDGKWEWWKCSFNDILQPNFSYTFNMPLTSCSIFSALWLPKNAFINDFGHQVSCQSAFCQNVGLLLMCICGPSNILSSFSLNFKNAVSKYKKSSPSSLIALVKWLFQVLCEMKPY